jgi:hypothetical protein
MKNWMLVLAGLFLAVGLTVSESANAEFPGMAPTVGVGVNVNVGYRAPVPFFPAPMYPVQNFAGGGFSHGFPGMFPPPMFPRPYCGPVMSPYGYGGIAPCCYRPYHRRHFSLAVRFGGFGFAINTGNSYI